MQALGYGRLFFHWKKILAQTPSVEQKPNGCELKNISAMSGKLSVFWVRQPSESSSPEKHPARGEEEMQGSWNWNGCREPERCWIIWFLLRKSEPCSTRPLLLKQPDSSCTLLVTSYIFSQENPFLFLHINQDMMDTFSITRFSVSGFFFSSFCSSPAYQIWPTASSKHEHIHRHKHTKCCLKTKYVIPSNFWSQH